jgi:hypothetical protein
MLVAFSRIARSVYAYNEEYRVLIWFLLYFYKTARNELTIWTIN